jgi:hypothetical protein
MLADALVMLALEALSRLLLESARLKLLYASVGGKIWVGSFLL